MVKRREVVTEEGAALALREKGKSSFSYVIGDLSRKLPRGSSQIAEGGHGHESRMGTRTRV